MRTSTKTRLAGVAGLAFVLLLSQATQLRADNHPQKKAVMGYIDWSLVPVNLGPYLIPGTDGDLYLRHLPLAGSFTMTGEGVSLQARIHVDLNGELDVNGNGVVWGTTVITTTIDGIRTLIFEGTGSAQEAALVSKGTMSLSGRGPYQGTKLEFLFQEIGPGNTDTYNYTGYLMPEPSK